MPFLRKKVRPTLAGTVVAVMIFVSAMALAGPRGSLSPFNRARQGFRQGAIAGVFSIKPRVLLDPITAMELTGAGGQMALSGGELSFGGGKFNELELRRSVKRGVPGLWRLRMPPQAGLYALDVSYELVDLFGRPSRLGSMEKGDSEIKVTIDEIPPRIVSRDAHSNVIEGGMVLHLQLESARTAGKYSGTLTVVVNHF